MGCPIIVLILARYNFEIDLEKKSFLIDLMFRIRCYYPLLYTWDTTKTLGCHLSDDILRFIK